jgi:uncharacterized protein YebE (UPF0316 family)
MSLGLILFAVGVIEMLIATIWTSFVSRAKVVGSGLVTIVNILIWYYVLQVFVSDIGNFKLVLIYAFGCSLGVMIGTYYFDHDNKAKSRSRKKAEEPKRAPELAPNLGISVSQIN